MPDEDKNFCGSLVLDFRKWLSRVQTENPKIINDSLKRLLGVKCGVS